MVTSFSDARDFTERKENDRNHRNICVGCHRSGGVTRHSFRAEAVDDCLDDSDDLIIPAVDSKFKSSSRCIPSLSSAAALGRFTRLSLIQQVHLLEVLCRPQASEGVCSGLKIRARCG